MDIHTELLDYYLTNHPISAAGYLETRPVTEILDTLQKVEYQVSADVLKKIHAPVAAHCIVKMDKDFQTEILNLLSPELLSQFVRFMNTDERDVILANLSQNVSKLVLEFLNYQEDEAGAIMESSFIVLPADITVNEAVKRIKESVYTQKSYVYVTDREQKIVGIVSFRKIVVSDETSSLSNIMDAPRFCIPAHTRIDRIVHHEGWKRYHVLPVVGSDSKLIGVIRHDAVIRRMEGHIPNLSQHPVHLMLQISELYWKGIGELISSFNALSGSLSDSEEKK